MLVEQRFHLGDILAQAIDLAQGVLVVVGDFGDEREDLGFVEAAERRAKPNLA